MNSVHLDRIGRRRAAGRLATARTEHAELVQGSLDGGPGLWRGRIDHRHVDLVPQVLWLSGEAGLGRRDHSHGLVGLHIEVGLLVVADVAGADASRTADGLVGDGLGIRATGDESQQGGEDGGKELLGHGAS